MTWDYCCLGALIASVLCCWVSVDGLCGSIVLHPVLLEVCDKKVENHRETLLLLLLLLFNPLSASCSCDARMSESSLAAHSANIYQSEETLCLSELLTSAFDPGYLKALKLLNMLNAP